MMHIRVEVVFNGASFCKWEEEERQRGLRLCDLLLSFMDNGGV